MNEGLPPEERFEKELAGRAKWKDAKYDVELAFTLEITDKCTLECAHCCAESGPHNNTFLEADLAEQLAEDSIKLFQRYPPTQGRIINSLYMGKDPKTLEGRTSSSIRITGGDPFLHPNWQQIIRSFSTRKQGLGYPQIDVETNGWWAMNDKNAREVILQLTETGADCVSMTCDYWHRQQNVFNNGEHGERINRIAKELGFAFRYIKIDIPLGWSITIENGSLAFIPQVTPIGRARNLDPKYWGDCNTHMCCGNECRLSPSPFYLTLGYTHNHEYTIGPQGNVYGCNSGRQFQDASLALGNLHERRLMQIIDGDSNPIVRTLREKGTRGLTELAGLSLARHYELYDTLTPCGLCHEMLKTHGQRISEAVRE